MFDSFRKSKIEKAQKINEKNNYMTLLSRDGVWFYSQMKSGTTYTIIFLINYINELYELELKDKDIFDILPFFHSTDITVMKTSPYELIQKQQSINPKNQLPLFIHTHHPILDFSQKRVLMTRNPLDYLVSSYFYFYVNRSKKVKIDKVWKKIIDRYIVNDREFTKILNNQAESSILIKYENLIQNPVKTFSEIVSHLDFPLAHEKIQSAVEKSQKKEIKNIEKAGNKPLVASSAFKASSFIRSGEIGDWKNHISIQLTTEIKAYLISEGIDISDNQFE